MANSGNTFVIGAACVGDGALQSMPVTEVGDANITSQYARSKKPKMLSKDFTGNRVAKAGSNKAVADCD